MANNIWNLNNNTFGLMVNEDFTNGVWNAILSQYFPSDRYLLIPEYAFRNRNRDIIGWGDIVVYSLASNRPVLVYEGKRAGGAYWKSQQSGKQVWDYTEGLAWRPAAIVAQGGEFCIYDGMGERVVEMAGIGKKEGVSITEDANQRTIAKYLTKIVENNWH